MADTFNAPLTSHERARITRKETAEKRKAQAQKDAKRYQEDRDRVAVAMRYILDHAGGATPNQLIFAAEVLDHIEVGAHIVPYQAKKIMDAEPVDLNAFAKAVSVIAEQQDQKNAT